ncbi:MAG: YbhB/YbcL family Raf kinase inhibitor-like protein [Gemmatimonadaceae bacterium]|nr:YbhB/YbcL family Raf kinase inhibitor-like protein [Gemmatimonadaceae bacterium]
MKIASRSAAALVSLLFAFPLAAKPSGFRFWSPDVQGPKLGLDQVFDGMGCTGKNISPALRWSGAPSATKSFAVTVYDPDAPTGSGWWHWTVYNIPAVIASLPRNAGSGAGLPVGAVQGMTDFGKGGYGGACPPKGDKPHRYYFTVFALNVPQIDVPATATAANVGFNVNAHTIAKASFVARYGR